jgi:hypothetical protein
MPMLLFMPWCTLDKTYNLGEIEILPFEREALFAECDEDVVKDLSKLLGAYKTIQGESVRRLTVVRYKGKSPIDELDDDQIGVAYDLLTLATFSSLATREILQPHRCLLQQRLLYDVRSEVRGYHSCCSDSPSP